MNHQLRVQEFNKDQCTFCLSHLNAKFQIFYRPYVDSNGNISVKKCCKDCFYKKSTD